MSFSTVEQTAFSLSHGVTIALMLFGPAVRFDVKLAAELEKETGIPFKTAPNKFEALVRSQFQ